MLPTTNTVTELKRAFSALSALNAKFRTLLDLRDVLHLLQQKIEFASEAAELRRKLERGASMGFHVKDLINAEFSSRDDLVRKVNESLRYIDELHQIATQYASIKRRINTDTDTVKQFEQILFYPEKHKEIKSLWHKIKQGV